MTEHNVTPDQSPEPLPTTTHNPSQIGDTKNRGVDELSQSTRAPNLLGLYGVIAATHVVSSWSLYVMAAMAWRGTVASELVYGLVFANVAILFFQFGYTVVITQIRWLLVDHSDEVHVVPIMAGFVLLIQMAFVLTPMLVGGVIIVPATLSGLYVFGWYFQCFARIKFVSSNELPDQEPLSLYGILMLPVWILALGGLSLCPFILYSAFSVGANFGSLLMTVSAIFVGVCIVPLFVCYAFLVISRWSYRNRVIAIALLVISTFAAEAIEFAFRGDCTASFCAAWVFWFFLVGLYIAKRTIEKRRYRLVRTKIRLTKSTGDRTNFRFDRITEVDGIHNLLPSPL